MIGYNAKRREDCHPRGVLPPDTCKEYPMGIKHSIACRRPVYGVGVNDASYITQPRASGKQLMCHFYRCWKGMLLRCYSDKFKSRNPTYIGCEVCDEWHSFIAFRAWMELQDWEGKQLDKDLIGDGKLYSPEICVFVSSALNNLFTDSGATRGELPIGVYWEKINKKYKAQIRVNGKKKSLGYFTSANEAHEAWLNAKLEIANGYLASESNPRIRYAIECGIAKLKCKYGRELSHGASSRQIYSEQE